MNSQIDNISSRLSVHSHKGGVGKTTFCYNFVKFFSKGRITKNGEILTKLLVIDLDSQMNLTCALLQDVEFKEHLENKSEEYRIQLTEEDQGDFFDSYVRNHVDINDETETTSEKKFRQERSWDIFNKLDLRFRPGLYSDCDNKIRLTFEQKCIIDLIPGSADTFKLSSIIDRSISVNDAVGLINTFLNQQICKISSKNSDITTEYDVILMDLSPDLSTLNQCLLRSSRYIVMPMTPDYFSKISIKLLKRNLYDELDENDEGPIVLGGFLSRTKMVLDNIVKAYRQFSETLNRSAKNNENGLNHPEIDFKEHKFLMGYIRPFESLAPLMAMQHNCVLDVQTKDINQNKIKDEAINCYQELFNKIMSRILRIESDEDVDTQMNDI